MIMDKYVKLALGDDWGNKYLAVEGEHLTKQGMACMRLGRRFEDGMSLRIRWPDGSLDAVRIQVRPVVAQVHDMGHKYEVHTWDVGFEVSQRGVVSWVGLHQVEVMESDLPPVRG